MKKQTWIAALYLSLVFLAGVLFGYVIDNLQNQRPARPGNPGQFRERYIASLQRELSLTPEQVAKVTAILDETGKRFHQLKKQMDPELQTIRQSQRQQIMAVLTAEQQPLYQKLLDERRRRMGQHFKHKRPTE